MITDNIFFLNFFFSLILFSYIFPPFPIFFFFQTFRGLRAIISISRKRKSLPKTQLGCFFFLFSLCTQLILGLHGASLSSLATSEPFRPHFSRGIVQIAMHIMLMVPLPHHKDKAGMLHCGFPSDYQMGS